MRWRKLPKAWPALPWLIQRTLAGTASKYCSSPISALASAASAQPSASILKNASRPTPPAPAKASKAAAPHQATKADTTTTDGPLEMGLSHGSATHSSSALRSKKRGKVGTGRIIGGQVASSDRPKV